MSRSILVQRPICVTRSIFTRPKFEDIPQLRSCQNSWRRYIAPAPEEIIARPHPPVGPAFALGIYHCFPSMASHVSHSRLGLSVRISVHPLKRRCSAQGPKFGPLITCNALSLEPSAVTRQSRRPTAVRAQESPDGEIVSTNFSSHPCPSPVLQSRLHHRPGRIRSHHLLRSQRQALSEVVVDPSCHRLPHP